MPQRLALLFAALVTGFSAISLAAAPPMIAAPAPGSPAARRHGRGDRRRDLRRGRQTQGRGFSLHHRMRGSRGFHAAAELVAA